MYCFHCGQRLAQGIRHCPNCGKTIFYDETGALDEQEARQETEAADGSQHYSYDDPYRNGSNQNSYYQNQYQSGSYNSGQYNYANSYQPPQPNGRDTFALISLISSICALVSCCVPYIGLPASIVGVVCGILGLKGRLRKNMALAGLIISVLALVINGLLLAAVIMAASNPEMLAEYYSQWGSQPFIMPDGI